MKFLQYLLYGILFGIILIKSEVASWFRIQEMFHFQSFHMYGVIGTAVVLGIIGIQLIKKFEMKDFRGEKIVFHDKDKSIARYLIGGIIFGLGWSLTGACPGPMVALLGYGYVVIIVAFLSATFGTFVYGLVRDKLPH